MTNTYSTSEVAQIIGLHPNTIRLYEEWEWIPKPERQKNGYRIFTDFHLEQLRLARTALEVEIIQSGLREMAFHIIKTSATGDFEEAEKLTNRYLQQVEQEQKNAMEAIEITKQLLSGSKRETDVLCLTRKQAAEYLQVTVDTLRNWELNGLVTIKRKQNGYRIYADEDIRQLKIIRALRCANYSLSSILRMLNELSSDPHIDIKEAIDTPEETDDIISVCDKLLTSLQQAEENAKCILVHIEALKKLI